MSLEEQIENVAREYRVEVEKKSIRTLGEERMLEVLDIFEQQVKDKTKDKK